MSDIILAGDFTIYYDAENGQKRIAWTGSATGTRTVNALYSALQKLFDDPAQMDDLIPMKADTPDIYRMQNQWFIDDTTVEHLTGGSLFSDKWKDGTTEHILVIGYAPTTEFNAVDIGRTILGATSTDQGTILDFNSGRKLVWIRPKTPGTIRFKNGIESYSIGASANGDTFAKVWQVSNALVYVDQTTAANDATVNNWTFFPAAVTAGDHAAMGFAQKFSKLVVNVGTAGAGTYTVAWEYWNGTAWTALAGVTDGTTGFKTAGQNSVTYTVPTDWATTSLNASPQLYWIRAKTDGGTRTTAPLGTQGWISGVGAGAFASHNRHGVGSKAGESAWVGITTIGAIEKNTHLYIVQEDPDKIATDVNIVATKGTSDWWADGQLNLLLKVKEADSVFGALPNSSPSTGVATFLARQYSKTYSHFISTALSTAGGNTVVPLSTSDDLDNTTGHRQFTGSAGTGTFVVDEVINKTGTNKQGVITKVAGTSAAPILDYYLIGDPITDFASGDTLVTGATSGATCTAGVPSNIGPAADTDLTFAHGQFLRDINENGVTDPYSIDLSNAALKSMAKAYERSKYLTRRGETATASTNGQQGQFYVGAELQVEYTGQAGGNFSQGRRVYDQTNDAEGIIVADHDDGTTGDVILRTVRGTFANTNVLSDSPDPTQAMNTNSFIVQVDASPLTVTDQSANALSAGSGDVVLFPATEAINDYVAVGAKKPFARVVFNNAGVSGVAGVGGVGTWEYWNGTAWVTLEAAPNFLDGTSDFTAAKGVQNLDFYPPADWQTRGLSDGTTNTQTLYFIRFIITTVYTTNPLYDTVGVEDLVTATINGAPRTITPVASAPFGTFPGASKFFMAPGLAPTAAQMAAGEAQKFSTIDDNGATKNPPNKQDVSVTNLLSGDTVSVFRRTGTAITKTQFTLAAGNNQGNTTLVVSATIPTDNPNIAHSKVRVISASGAEHRYRYASYAAATFTLDAASTGTATAGSTNTVVIRSAGSWITDNVEVGDLIRNTTDNKVSTVVTVDSATQLTVTDNGTTWASKAFNLNTLVETYATPNAYVPMIERVTAATSEKTTITYTADVDVRVDVRRTAATAILPFSQDSTVGSTGLAIAAIRNADTIIV